MAKYNNTKRKETRAQGLQFWYRKTNQINVFICSNIFTLVRAKVAQEPILGTLSVRQE